MRLVTSIMSLHKLLEEDKNKIIKLFSNEYPYRMETYTFHYDESKYYEFDIDLFDVEFKKETIYQDINRLISLYEKIIVSFPFALDFIVGNDDTTSAVMDYENNWEDVGNAGLFVTNRKIQNLKPYYSSNVCNAYVNFRYVSFGCIY
ncbi:MAG: hypothetical protein HFJ57_07940 [Clostridia bacterium]|nr:hypothetical protein [Clostridia bacterium]